MVKPQRLEVFRWFNLNLLALQKLPVDIQKGRSRALYSLAVLRSNANDGSDVKQYDSVNSLRNLNVNLVTTQSNIKQHTYKGFVWQVEPNNIIQGEEGQYIMTRVTHSCQHWVDFN